MSYLYPMLAYSSRIDSITHDFTTAFGSLATEQLNWKPNPETWSIAQNIDHIIVLNSTYFPTFDALKAGTYKPPFISKIGFLVTMFGKMILKSVLPENQKKQRTFPTWEPAKSEISSDILNRFVSHQEELKKRMEESAIFIMKGVVISSPANKNIVYKLDKAFEIILTHEERHYKQAKNILQMMSK